MRKYSESLDYRTNLKCRVIIDSRFYLCVKKKRSQVEKIKVFLLSRVGS